MQKFLSSVVLVTSLVFAWPAHANSDGEFFGTLFGAGFGGLIGNQFGHKSGRVATTAVGVFAGGYAGGRLGHSLDQMDYPPYAYGYNYAPDDIDPPIYYQNTYEPNYVAPPAPPPPPATYIDDQGAYCREFTEEVNRGGRIQETYGTACLGPDGSWHMVQ